MNKKENKKKTEKEKEEEGLVGWLRPARPSLCVRQPPSPAHVTSPANRPRMPLTPAHPSAPPAAAATWSRMSAARCSPTHPFLFARSCYQWTPPVSLPLFIFSTPCSTASRSEANSDGRAGQGVTLGPWPCPSPWCRAHANSAPTTHAPRCRSMRSVQSLAIRLGARSSGYKATASVALAFIPSPAATWWPSTMHLNQERREKGEGEGEAPKPLRGRRSSKPKMTPLSSSLTWATRHCTASGAA